MIALNCTVVSVPLGNTSSFQQTTRTPRQRREVKTTRVDYDTVDVTNRSIKAVK